MNNQSDNRRTFRLPALLTILMFAGLARIGLTLVDDYVPGHPAPSATVDSVTIRRSLQVVTLSLQALAAHFGCTGDTRSDDQAVELFQAGGHHLE